MGEIRTKGSLVDMLKYSYAQPTNWLGSSLISECTLVRLFGVKV
jgi:hypothetical protein